MNEKFDLWQYLLYSLGFWLINMIFLNISMRNRLKELKKEEKAKAEKEDTKNNKARSITNQL